MKKAGKYVVDIPKRAERTKCKAKTACSALFSIIRHATSEKLAINYVFVGFDQLLSDDRFKVYSRKNNKLDDCRI